jgi:leukotriene-A4 hydrolase
MKSLRRTWTLITKAFPSLLALGLTFFAAGCSAPRPALAPGPTPDPFTYANPAEARVTAVALDLEVSPQEKRLSGSATLTIDRARPGEAGTVVLDSRALDVSRADAGPDLEHFTPTTFLLGANDRIMGAPLKVALPANARVVRIRYATSPEASGLQWLDPAQTAARNAPFLYSQSESTHARSWIPLQDSPGIRVTYSARIHVPEGLQAVMSAEGNPGGPFHLDQPIPPYLIALAVGKIGFESTGSRTGVYAEMPVVHRAAAEFEDTEKMVRAAERLFGPYRWGRYDMLVLPPSFPYGGMENPRLTTLTPTIIAGDRSLVAVVSHELAHSWSGNLVTNATWSDFWLNEGFTTYLERRIQEELYGREREEMEAVLEKADLEDEMRPMEPRETVLHIDLTGRDPNDSSGVPYVKGMLFLRMLEEHFGRHRFDAFLRGYFDHFAFQSITTMQMEAYFFEHLFNNDQKLAADLRVKQWLYEPGMPPNAPQPRSTRLDRVSQEAADWVSGKLATARLGAAEWSTQEWIRFLHEIPPKGAAPRMAELDRAFHVTGRANAEVGQRWLLLAIQSRYAPAYPRLERFLTEVGRMWYIVPLYKALAETPDGRARAQQVFERARGGYHPITRSAVQQVLSK